jgi:hypothetical protein
MAAELSIKIKGDTSDFDRKIGAIPNHVKATTAALGKAVGELNSWYSQTGRFAGEVSKDLQKLERQATQAASAIKRLNIERSGGGRLPTEGGGLAAGAAGYIAGSAGAALAAEGAFAYSSVNAYREAAGAQISLAAAASRANVSLAEQDRIVASLQQKFGFTKQDAQSAFGGALRVAQDYGHPEDAQRLLEGAIRASLASGKGAGYAGELLQAVRSGSDEPLNAVGLANPGQIYGEYAKSIGTTGDRLSHAQQEQSVANKIILEGAQAAGVAADATNTYAARIDRLTNSLADFRVQSGAGISSLILGTYDVARYELGLPDANAERPSDRMARLQAKQSSYTHELADIDRFRAGLGTGAFSRIGTEGRATDDQRARFADFDAQARTLAGQAQADHARFDEAQRAARAAALPGLIADATAKAAAAQSRFEASVVAQGSLESRIASLTPHTRATGGFRTGFYGQQTDESVYETTYGDTPAERAERAFRQAGDYARDVGGTPQDIAAFARQYRLAETASINPSDLTESERQQLRQDAIDEKRERREAEATARKQRDDANAYLKRLTDKVAPVNGERDPKPEATFAVINQVPGTKATLGTPSGGTSSTGLGGPGAPLDDGDSYSNQYR